MSKDKQELLTDEEIENIGKIETTLNLESIQLKKMRWTAKVYINETLPKTYRIYRFELALDETPYLSRIDELNKDFDASLFSGDASQKKIHDRKIADLTKQLETLRSECEEIQFSAILDEIKYKDIQTMLVIRLPDDVIEPFNRQKTRFDLYKLTLIPKS